MNSGIIIRSLSGFYTVLQEGQRYICKARGRFRHEKTKLLVGDKVIITPLSEDTGVIDEVLPRKNVFDRPPVSNIDQLIIVAANAIPITVPYLIDRMTCIAEMQSCEPVICINKTDLDPAEELEIIYRKAGYTTIKVSAETGDGMEELKAVLRGKISAITGNSGVGKSSILNNLLPELKLETDEVSQHLGRGKHTTRHVELYQVADDALIADTPGFSSVDVGGAFTTADELPLLFREFKPYLDQCRFIGCTHTKEQGCRVLEAVKNEDISKTRHESYISLFNEMKQHNPWDKK